jgi:signal transduction histidine kinase
MTRTASSSRLAEHRHDLSVVESRLLADRLRGGLMIALAGIVLYALADLALGPPHLLLLFAIKLGLAAVLIATMMRLGRAGSPRALAAVAVLAMSAIYLSSAASGVLTSDLASTALLTVVFSMATAASLPWGVRAQLATVAVAVVAVVATAIGVTGGVAPLANYPAIAIVIALAGSVYVAYEHERHGRARDRLASLLDGQTEVLEMVALHHPLPDVLAALCHVVERHGGDGLLCSVLLLRDGTLHHGAAPSLPESWNAAVEGLPIGPSVGSCGTAAFTKSPVIVSDIATDHLWEGARELPAAHGLRACWSAPILAQDGRCLGTFAMYYRTPRTPDARAWHALEVATHLAGLAIEQRESADALASSRRRLEEESHVAGALVQVGHEINSMLSTPEILARLCELTTELVDCDCSDTVLRQADGETYLLTSAHGYADDELESLRALSMPADVMAPLVAALDRDGLVQLPTSVVEEPVAQGLLRRYRITVSMYVALRRGGEMIGILSCACRGRTELFTPVHQRVARGIAQLAALALENARLVEELRAASQLKTEFVSTMSHELRTPLSVILGYTDMLEEDLPRQEQERTLARIRRSGVELLEMIEATLNLSRLEAGKDLPRYEPLRLRDLTDELAAEFGAIECPTGTMLQWDVAETMELVSDRRKLKIVLKNLVANALKFTPRGVVVVGCRLDGERCVVAVRDTGVGIAPDDLPVIFEMFRQVDSSDSRSFSGVGLGLYIVRRLVDQLGGAIDVASELGRGTTFTVTLPLRPSHAATTLATDA